MKNVKAMWSGAETEVSNGLFAGIGSFAAIKGDLPFPAFNGEIVSLSRSAPKVRQAAKLGL